MQRSFLIVLLIGPVVLLLSRCLNKENAGEDFGADARFNQFAGSAACVDCHKKIYDDFIHTAHYMDSRPSSGETIKGSFDSGRNRFDYSGGMEVVLEHNKNGFFQTARSGGKVYKSEPFNVVIGSGRKGQTYLYWDKEKLFQLPVSYFTPMDCWCNSPGFPSDSALFNRRVPAYCLECHSTYARTVFISKTEYGDFFDKSRMIYGITCEKCHGPGAEHVAYYKTHSGERTAKYIINPELLSRKQRLDLCALCHSGRRIPLMPAFSFKVGDRLDEFSEAGFESQNAPTLDVHANQFGLLTSSKCFKQSQMDCSSCHNVHVNEVSSLQLFSQRCMTCHNTVSHNTCTIMPAQGLVLSENCIDCHMPGLPSQKIILQLSWLRQSIANLVRTHRIAIYPESTREYLKKLASRKAPRS
jgi:Cytochrome c554 and c-prime